MTAKTEHNIQALSLIQACKNKGVFIFRNHVGKYKSMDGKRVLNIGLVGSSDAMGAVTVKIDESWLGCEIPLFFCSEFKTQKGKQRPDQVMFEENMKNRGIPYRLIRSPEEMQQYIDDIKAGVFLK